MPRGLQRRDAKNKEWSRAANPAVQRALRLRAVLHIDRLEALHISEHGVDIVVRDRLVVLREIDHRRIELAAVAGDPLGERAIELGNRPGGDALGGEVGGGYVLL